MTEIQLYSAHCYAGQSINQSINIRLLRHDKTHSLSSIEAYCIIFVYSTALSNVDNLYFTDVRHQKKK